MFHIIVTLLSTTVLAERLSGHDPFRKKALNLITRILRGESDWIAKYDTIGQYNLWTPTDL